MKSRLIVIGIFLSLPLIAAGGGLYWMAVQAQAGQHRLAITTVQKIQQLESQWSVETARVRSDPFADFDSLTRFIPQIARLKQTLANTILDTPSLPSRLVNNMNAYLSATTAKEERIERFKTGYAVLRNSVRYLPLAATNMMQQMQARGADPAFVQNVATVTDELNTYLASPNPSEKERLARILVELGNNIAGRQPALVNTAMNFVAHGQVLLEKQAPTEEIFQDATSSQLGDMGEALIKGLQAEIDQKEALAAWYERGIIGSGVALWMVWLTIVFKMPRRKDQTREGVYAMEPRPEGEHRPRPGEEIERLTADLMKVEQFNDAGESNLATASLTAYQVGVNITAEQIVSLAERVNWSANALTDMQAQPADNGAGVTNGDIPDADREALGSVVASICSQANGIADLAKHLPALMPQRAGGSAPVELNDCVDEVVDSIQAKTHTLLVKELHPLPTVMATESDLHLMFTNIIENAVSAIQERGQKKGIIRVETKQEEDCAIVTFTDNGCGIQPEHRKKVFHPFYTTREGALGMGLSVAQHLVEKYDGSIHINSIPDRGTAVRFTLPTSQIER